MSNSPPSSVSSKVINNALNIYKRKMAKTSAFGMEIVSEEKGDLPEPLPLLQPRIYAPLSRTFTVDMSRAKEVKHLSRYLYEKWGSGNVEDEMYSHQDAESHYCTADKPHNFFRYPQYDGADTVQLKLAKVTDNSVWYHHDICRPRIDPGLFIFHRSSVQQTYSDICRSVQKKGETLADAWETMVWIEQYCNRWNQEYDDRIHALRRFGRRYEKAPTVDDGYTHSTSSVARVIFQGISADCERGGWKARTIPVSDGDPNIFTGDYFLIKQ